jgi:hypothetical protein
VTLTVGGSMTNSEAIAPTSDVSADVGGSFSGSVVVAGGDASVTVGGYLGSSVHSTGNNVTLDVGGQVRAGAAVTAGDDLVAEMDALFGAIQAERIDLKVNNNVGSAATILAESVLDIDLDTVGFEVGGDFSGRLDVATAFDTGTGTRAVVVGGALARGSKFNVAGTFGTIASAGEFVFNGPISGEFILGTDLDVDLTVFGTVADMAIAGAVNGDILVRDLGVRSTSRVNSLSTGSLFNATSATQGEFLDGVGATLGELVADDGWDSIVPTA